jgi:hypothetical protein
MITGPAAVVFSASGKIETYVVPATGGYIVEAAGAETVLADGSAVVCGDRIKGMFYLNRGDILKILVGRRESEPSVEREREARPGGSIVWRGAGDLFLPAQLMLAAAGGGRALGAADAGAVRDGVLGSFNSGAFQVNSVGVNRGDGCVTIVPVTAPVACGTKDELARFAQTGTHQATPDRGNDVRTRAFARGIPPGTSTSGSRPWITAPAPSAPARSEPA